MSLFVDIEKKIGDFRLNMKFSCEDERVALLGASGAGKSQTLKCIAGIETPDRGKIILDGRTLFDSERGINIHTQKRKVGFLFQDYALFPNMTVYQNILCSIRKDSEKYKDRKKAALDILEKMDLMDVKDNRATDLSGGQKQRTALARILVNDADIMLLDEPFSALDEHLKFRLYGELERVMKEFGKTVLIVTHDRDEAYRLADRMIIVDKGSITASGTVRDIFEDPVTAAGARLTGVKNIAAAAGKDDGKIFVPAWNMLLDKPAGERDVTAVGIRMHSIIPGMDMSGPEAGSTNAEGTRTNTNAADGSITLNCLIDDIRETPFTFVVSLKGEGFSEPLLMETGKKDFRYRPGDSIKVEIDINNIMALGGTYEL